MTATPTPGALARLLDVSDADLRALLVGAAVRLPDLTGLLIAADRAADAGEVNVEERLRLMHHVATDPLEPLSGYGRVTVARLLEQTGPDVGAAVLAGVVLGAIGNEGETFPELHPAAAAVALLAGSRAAAVYAALPLEVPDGPRAVTAFAARTADYLLRARQRPDYLLPAALRYCRWCGLRVAKHGQSVACRAATRAMNVIAGALASTAKLDRAELREMQIAGMRGQRRRLAGSVQGG